MIHNHDWRKIKLLDEYYDYSGYRVGVFSCECEICGKRKKKKFY